MTWFTKLAKKSVTVNRAYTRVSLYLISSVVKKAPPLQRIRRSPRFTPQRWGRSLPSRLSRSAGTAHSKLSLQCINAKAHQIGKRKISYRGNSNSNSWKLVANAFSFPFSAFFAFCLFFSSAFTRLPPLLVACSVRFGPNQALSKLVL